MNNINTNFEKLSDIALNNLVATIEKNEKEKNDGKNRNQNPDPVSVDHITRKTNEKYKYPKNKEHYEALFTPNELVDLNNYFLTFSSDEVI